MEASAESTVDGNPLDSGDEIYTLRGSYRLFSGEVGFETGISFAEPTSDFVHGIGRSADLVLWDFSVVWYANYKYLNNTERASGLPWHRNSRIKPELIVFGGPGLALLNVNDPFPGTGDSRVFVTVNAGVGAKLHFTKTDHEKGYDHMTSRFYLRPEIRARWFTGEDGKIDWGVGLAVGYCLGDRPSILSLRLKVTEACKATERYLSGDVANALGQEQSLQQDDELLEETLEYRRRMEELKVRVLTCGRKCSADLACLEEGVVNLNDAITKLRPGRDSVD